MHVQRLLDESCTTAAATIRILYELQAAKDTSSVDLADAVFADLEGQSVDDPDLEPEPASAANSSPTAAGVFVFKASGAEPASAPASTWAWPPAPTPVPVQSRPMFSESTGFPTPREDWTASPY